MTAITLDQAKAHLRVGTGDSDAYITDLLDAAIDHIGSIDVDTSVDPLPAPVRQAALLLIGHWYENREAVTVGFRGKDLPMGVDRLLAPYRELET